MSRIAINDLTLQDTPFLFDLTDEEMSFITGGSFWTFLASLGETIAGGVVAAVGVVVAAVGIGLGSESIAYAGAGLVLTGVNMIDDAWR